MQHDDTSRPGPAQVPAIDTARLNDWVELKDQLQQLHAQLEWMRLMLKMRLPG